MKYLLDISKLKIGDIILESGSTKVISTAIKAATKSNFSHAMLYRDHSLVHAVNEGVFSKNPQRILVSEASDLKVLRLREEVNSEVLEKVCYNAGTKIGSVYSKTEAIKTLIADDDESAKSRDQFCSRLVAQCYEAEGINLVSNSDYCSPEDLNRSNMLFEVSDAVREASKGDLDFYETEDPNLENQIETFKWLRKSRVLFKAKKVDIQTINDVSQALIDHRDMDKKICRLMSSTKYLDLYDADRKINHYRYDNELFSQKVEEMGIEAESLIRAEIRLNQGEISRHSKNLAASRENYKAGNLKFSKLHVKLSRSLLKESKKRLEVVISCLPEGNIYRDTAISELTTVENILK